MPDSHTQFELLTPDWLNRQFFEKVLRQSENDDEAIKVTDLKISPATANYDHYGSSMYRARVEYSSFENTQITKSLIVKTMPVLDTIKMDMLGDTTIFETEIRIYSETIPRMEAVLRQYGDDTVLGPSVVYSALKPHKVIVFEDLAEKGFSTLKNRIPTEEEIKRAMLKIAKWHAVSYKLAEEEPETIKSYNDGTANWDLGRIDLFVNGIKKFINTLLASDDELKKYKSYFEELDKDILERCSNLCNAFKRGDKAIFVLNHGDFHLKNMMFRQKDSGEFDDLVLIDFQMCYYGPAVADVIYSMYMLWNEDMRWNRRDEMVYYYFSNFIESLRRFEFKGELPKMADLQFDLINYRFFETFLLVTHLPFTLPAADETKEIDSTEDGTVLYNPIVVDEIKRMLVTYLLKAT